MTGERRQVVKCVQCGYEILSKNTKARHRKLGHKLIFVRKGGSLQGRKVYNDIPRRRKSQPAKECQIIECDIAKPTYHKWCLNHGRRAEECDKNKVLA